MIVTTGLEDGQKRGPRRDDVGPREDESPRINVVRVTLGAVFSVIVFLATQLSMLTRDGWSLASFRAYSASDQLANFALVVNGAHGNFSSVEPFTETGSMIDPHLYFTVLGVVAHLFGIAAVVVYNVAGIGSQVLLVVGLSLGFAVITRRWWAAGLGAVPFVLGTLSTFSGSWYTGLQSHAVLWGAFGVMFAINSQSLALVVAGLAVTALIVLAKGRWGTRGATVMGVAVGVAVGALANVDTYGFFTALFFTAYGVAVFALAQQRRWGPAAVSVVLLLWVFAVGDTLASAVGRVAIVAVALIPAVPGIWLTVARWRARAVAPLVGLAVAASPQLIRFALATHSGDAFLRYRGTSSAGLTVPAGPGLLCALPLLVPLALILLVGLRRRSPLWISYSVGSAVAWFLLAENNLWGANQEPYQLWIDGYALVAFTVIPVLIDVVLALRHPPDEVEVTLDTPWWRVAIRPRWTIFAVCSVAVWFEVAKSHLWGTSYAPWRWSMSGVIVIVATVVPILVDAAAFRDADAPRPFGVAGGRGRLVVAALLMISIGIAELSVVDWYHFYLTQEHQSFTFSTVEDKAMLAVAKDVSNEKLVLVDRCIDPEIFKAVTGDRVAFYSLGLAWPTHYQAISVADESVTSDSLTLAQARRAGIGWLVTLRACRDQWPRGFARSLEHVATQRIGRSPLGSLTLWKVSDGSTH